MAAVGLAVLGVIALCCAAGAIFLLLRKRLTPEELEKARRLAVNANGRLVDGVVSDAGEHQLQFDYSWRGMQYHSSQDISTLQHLVLRDIHSLIGPVTIKFDVRNPYNSIVLCEEWSGFAREQVSLEPRLPR